MQNETTLEQQIKEFESNMPPDIMKMIKEFDWKKELRMIVQQNQLMIDVGNDLEQATYLLILGVIKSDDMYERLSEVHEIEEDQAQKIMQDLEDRIFNPLYKKLVQLENTNEPQKEGILTRAQKSEDPESRDDILAEIEREPHGIDEDDEDLILRSIPHPSVSIDTRDPRMEPGGQTPVQTPVLPHQETQTPGTQAPSTPIVQSPGVAQPFSLDMQGNRTNPQQVVPQSQEATVQQSVPQQVAPSPLFKMNTQAPQAPETITGIRADHIESALKKPTSVTNELSADTPVPTKGYVADPYREPIQ